ncbi:MAG TPA: GNAT family N-acetyltransferase [Vicinamibacterales bacterium]|nr:GNAT family N-acetyltransferase [Vicinamibacterales bacterium]
MITGQWGKPSEVLLDIVVDADGAVGGIVNPGRQNAPIRHGRFDENESTVELSGEVASRDGPAVPFRIAGRLDGRTLRLSYTFGDDRGIIELVRVEEYRPPRLKVADRLKARLADIRRYLDARSRPKAEANAKRLRDRAESLDSIIVRDAVAADIPALAELHVITWNATYRTSRGPSVSTRARQWTEVFGKQPRRDFVVVLEDRNGRLIGFAAGKPDHGEFAGQLSKMYLRWEYHGLGLGRRLMAETARRFLDRGIKSFVLFAERSNPTIGFYDRMGGERLIDERGLFTGAYAWRDVRKLLE